MRWLTAHSAFASRKRRQRARQLITHLRQRTAMSVATPTKSRRIWIASVLVSMILAAVGYFGFIQGRAEIKNIRVDHYLHPAMGVAPCLCLGVDDDGSGMQPLYAGIEGFHYTWGTSYVLKVKVEKVSNPPADGSSVRYTLVSIVKESKVPEGTRFRVHVIDQAFLRDQSILGQRRFEYASDKVQQDFEIRQAALAFKGEGFWAEFSHSKSPDKPLILEGVSSVK